jgi:hypothetical protein
LEGENTLAYFEEVAILQKCFLTLAPACTSQPVQGPML